MPGYGAQGATAEDVSEMFSEDGLGAVVNSARGILFACRRPEYKHIGLAGWQEATRGAVCDTDA